MGVGEMKKALEILKDIQDSKWCGVKPTLVNWNLEDFNEAIKELQDLQNRTCENCKYNKEQDNFMIFCDKTMCQDGSKMMWHSFTKDFSCKFWELQNEKI